MMFSGLMRTNTFFGPDAVLADQTLLLDIDLKNSKRY